MTNLIFDYDGTIHDSIKIYKPSFEKAYEHLVSLNLAERRNWKESEISRWLGFSSKDMWNEFMPDLSQKIKDRCSQIIGENMVQLTNEGKAQLYPHATEVLEQLKEFGYRLIFLSNCKYSYLEAHKNTFQLENYFSSFYCTEEFDFQPKYVIFDIIKKKYSGEFIIIGDRFQDMEIALKHQLKSIGCIYGYGQPWELENADGIAVEVRDILSFLI